MRSFLSFSLLLVGVPSAMAALNGPCNVGGQRGTCVSTAKCRASGGQSHINYCPDDPDDIRCCTGGGSSGLMRSSSSISSLTSSSSSQNDIHLNGNGYSFDEETRIEGFDRTNSRTSGVDRYGSSQSQKRPSISSGTSRASGCSLIKDNSSPAARRCGSRESSCTSTSGSCSTTSDQTTSRKTTSKPQSPKTGSTKAKSSGNRDGARYPYDEYTMDNDKTFVNTWCQAGGVEGKCQMVSAKGCPKGKFAPGECPGSKNVQCCISGGKKTTGSSKSKGSSEFGVSKPGVVQVIEAEVTDYYTGSRIHPRRGRSHWGVDLGAPIGTPIRSPLGGTCISSGDVSGFGKWVRVQHPSGTITVYGHVSRRYVKVGDRVTAGMRIADVGVEGITSGPHLHMEVFLPGGGRTDPQRWMDENGFRYT